MVNKLLKVERVGKTVLRIGISIYMISVAWLSTAAGIQLGMAILMVFLIAFSVFLMLHFKKPKIGLIGGLGAIVFFLGSAIFLLITDVTGRASLSLIYLHVIKDLLLLAASIVLTGESLKEVVRQKITAPFPKA